LQASFPVQAAPATSFTAQDPAPFTHTLYLPLALREGVCLPRVSVSLTPTGWVTLQSYAETTWAEVLSGTQVFSSSVPELCGVGSDGGGVKQIRALITLYADKKAGGAP
jgi:hypothetical protein